MLETADGVHCTRTDEQERTAKEIVFGTAVQRSSLFVYIS